MRESENIGGNISNSCCTYHNKSAHVVIISCRAKINNLRIYEPGYILQGSHFINTRSIVG